MQLHSVKRLVKARHNSAQSRLNYGSPIGCSVQYFEVHLENGKKVFNSLLAEYQ